MSSILPSNYPNGFASGLVARGVSIAQVHPNQAIWVDSNAGTNNNRGTWQRPVATLAQALTIATSNKGDIIFLKPGHAESVTAAAGIAIADAGVTIIGLGSGTSRPTFTFTTATTATITVTAANVTLQNIIFANGIDALATMLSISATDCRLVDCEIQDNNASFACLDPITTTAAAHRLQIYNHVHRAAGGKTGGSSAIKIVGGNDHIVNPYFIDGDFSNAAIYNPTTASSGTGIQVFGNAQVSSFIRNRNASKVLLSLQTASPGRVGPYLYGEVASSSATGLSSSIWAAAGCVYYQPVVTSSTGFVGYNTTITAATS